MGARSQSIRASYQLAAEVPGRVVFSGVSADQENEDGLESFPDPVARAIECMLERIPKMELEIRTLKEALKERGEAVPPSEPVPLKKTD